MASPTAQPRIAPATASACISEYFQGETTYIILLAWYYHLILSGTLQMNDSKYSWLAITSVLLNLPYLASLLWCCWQFWSPGFKGTGEILLLPFCFWAFLVYPALSCGILALVKIQSSNGSIQGRWIAFIGIALAMIGPVFALYSWGKR